MEYNLREWRCVSFHLRLTTRNLVSIPRIAVLHSTTVYGRTKVGCVFCKRKRSSVRDLAGGEGERLLGNLPIYKGNASAAAVLII